MAWKRLDHAGVPRKRAQLPQPTPFGSVADARLDIEVPIDDGWKRAVRLRLKEMRQGVDELAAHVGCSQGNISQTLGSKRHQRTSRFAHAISLATGVALPLEGEGVLMLKIGIEKDVPGLGGIVRGLAQSYGVRLV